MILVIAGARKRKGSTCLAGPHYAIAIAIAGLCATETSAKGVASDQNAATGAAASNPSAGDAADSSDSTILVMGHHQYGSVATDLPAEAHLNATAISALGAADVNEVFADLAPEFKSGLSMPGAATQTPIVLVNGQRIASFSAVRDLPPEAILRMDVFPEQVGLQFGYGGDRKVVNIVLRRGYHALTLLGRYTAAPEYWRGIYRAKADLLHIDQHAHYDLDIDFSHLDPIFAADTIGDFMGAPRSGIAPPARTLAAQSDELVLSGNYNRDFGTFTAELAARIDLSAQQSRLGLADLDGDLMIAQGSVDYLSGPRYRADETVDAQSSLALNGVWDSWRWSFIGQLDDTTHDTRTAGTASAGTFAAILLPSPALLGDHCDGVLASYCVATDKRTARGDLYLNGKLLSLPAGDVAASFRVGFVASGIRSQSVGGDSIGIRNRTEGDLQANLDVPITSKSSLIGKTTIGLNGVVRRFSDFGTLSDAGATLQWAPARAVQIIASFRSEQQIPTLDELTDAMLATPDLREFDFVTGETSIVSKIASGNGSLVASRSRIASARIQVTPLASTDLQLSAEYTLEQTRDPIVTISAATAATMAAFPGLFTRNADGYLVKMALQPVNLAQRDQQQLRWGLNYTVPLGAARPETVGGGPTPAQFQIALYDTWRFHDLVTLHEGEPALNLLNGGFLSDLGGTPAHELELQTTLATRRWSADINARWQTPTTIDAGPNGNERLTFSQGVTINVRFQLNLGEQRWLTRLLPFVRGKLNLSADNILGAHVSVHNATGMVPPAYSQAYLNPTGRTFRITFRKRFH